jgi:hypothetical protein
MIDIANIDWIFIFAHFLWILGASFLLALFGYFDFQIHAEKRSRREVFKMTSFKIFFLLGLSFVFSGIGLSASFFWLGMLFGVMSALCFISILVLYKQKRS